MSKPRIFVSIPRGEVRDTFFNPQLKQQLEEIGIVTWNPGSEQFSEEEFARQLKGIDICVTGWGNTPLNQETLKYADDLKLIAHVGGTVRPMVADEAFERGIRVCCGNAVFARSVAEGVIAYILSALRRIPEYNQAVKDGQWPSPAGTRGLLDRSVGLVGYGMIAQYTAEMLKAFGCPVKVYSRYMKAEDLAAKGLEKATMEEIFAECDIVSLHQGLTPQTQGSIGRNLFASMKDGAVLVNTARGELIDEEALCQVLNEKAVTAVLDVFVHEPLPMDSPLRRCPNVFLMPHGAGPTGDRRPFVTAQILEDIKAFLTGGSLSCEIDAGRAKTMTTVVK